MSQHQEEPNNLSIIVYGIITTVGLFLVVIVLAVLFGRAVQREINIKIAADKPQALLNLRARENELLHKYALLEDNPQFARINIEHAMELEIQAPWRNSIQLSGEAAAIAGPSNVQPAAAPGAAPAQP